MGRKSICAPDQTRLRIQAMEEERALRRNQIKQARVDRAAEEKRNISAGNPGDVDFIGLVRRWREEHAGIARPHRHHAADIISSTTTTGKNDNICVCVRKRPLNDKERKKKEHDAVTVLHPTATVHSAKLRVDGIQKYLDHNSFRFDHSFDEDATTEEVYQYTAKPLVSYVCGGKGARATVFAYGQTGSGKTFTMSGIQKMVADDIFSTLSDNVLEEEGWCNCENTTISIAIFEIYGGRIQDLLNKRNRLKVLEDGRGEVVISGLEEFEASTPDDFLALIEDGQNNRTTHATEANDESSRSHAICQVLFRDSVTKKLKGKLSLVDLAGSERGSDTKSHNRQRRTESSEINTSLLALKECIRAIDGDSRHVPYRQSKLTLILKDSFTSNSARTAMIATLAPGSLSTDHTVNTLRYADRIKEKKIGDSFTTTPSSQRSPMRHQKPPDRNELVEKVDIEEQCDEIDENINSNINYEDDNWKEEETQDLTKFDDKLDIEAQGPTEFDELVQQLFEEEEQLLSLHMQAIQQNAEYITEENKLLESVQGEDYDMDAYALRLTEILQHKTEMIQALRGRLEPFRELLRKEEELSKKY
jgi:kinesin family protein 2/24